MNSFAPFQELAEQLLSACAHSGDGSHDLSHIARVWKNAQVIQAEEGGDLKLLAASVLLHDCVTVEKNSPQRGQAAYMSAIRARNILGERRWPAAEIETVADAIERHSFSAGLRPEAIEARILQDADRLDAIGAIGIARCFYTAGRMGSLLYEPSDPRGEERDLDDARYALDHFPKKLLTLSNGFATKAGARLAQQRHDGLQAFYDAMIGEIAGPVSPSM